MNLCSIPWPYADRPAWLDTGLYVQGRPDLGGAEWPRHYRQINWGRDVAPVGDRTAYLRDLAGDRIAFDELTAANADQVDWRAVAAAVRAPWVVFYPSFCEPTLRPVVQAFAGNPNVIVAAELYSYAEDGGDCHRPAVAVLNEVAALVPPSRIAVILNISDDNTKTSKSYRAATGNPGVKWWRDRGLIQRAWHNIGVRHVGAWWGGRPSEAARQEWAQAVMYGINGPLLDISGAEWR